LKETKIRLIPAALVMASAILLAAFWFAEVFKERQLASQVLRVVGSAKQEITSDLGTVSARLSSSGNSAQEAFRALEAQKPALIEFLNSWEIADADIKWSAAHQEVQHEYNNHGMMTGNILGYSYHQRFQVSSVDVYKIERLALAIPGLVQDNINIYVEQPSYLYTDLAQAKVDVQSLAAADAMLRAEQISQATSSVLGPIRSARMGVLQITPRHSTIVSDYGMNDTSSIEKDITAVVQAEFTITSKQ